MVTMAGKVAMIAGMAVMGKMVWVVHAEAPSSF